MANVQGYAQDSYIQESRKRPIEDQDGGRDAKRYNTGNYPLLKLLVPNYAAGALIGKGGSCLNEIKEKYGGFIRLSTGREYYPGTDERVVVITGEVNQIIDISNHVMEKVLEPGRDATMRHVAIDADRGRKVKIVLTNGAAGFLIGKSGATIKAIQESTKATVSVEMIDKASVPGERVVTVSGSLDGRTEACRQIIEKISVEASNMANTKTKYTNGATDMYAAPGGGGGGYEGHIMSPFNRQPQDGGMLAYQRGNDAGMSAKLKAKVTVEIEVPNVMVGPILGKQGVIIKDFVQRSGGARFKFSDKSDDSESRTLTITGNMDQAQVAYSLVNDKVEELRNQPVSTGF